jgi:heme/copper-type cytochrome/quinol oxidase subunit 2
MRLNQRFGLIMIIATLLVMVATVYILFDYQRDNRATLASRTCQTATR